MRNSNTFISYTGQKWLILALAGFRMVIFSILLMAVVLFYSRGIMGNKEFSWEGLFRLIRGIPHKLKGKKKKASASKKGGAQ